MQAISVACPAKINTFLAVGPPDDRGWHPLRSIFQEIELADTLSIRPAEGDSITFSIPGVPEKNTVSEALRLLREHLEIPPLAIHIEKEIPTESGLGGGSTDAAGLLRTLGKALAPGLLAEIALRVGADVPFFLLGGRAKAEGYGEILTPLPDLPVRHLVLARPAEGCATPQMFRNLDAKPRDFRHFPDTDVLYNDFERVAPCGSLDLIERLQVHGADDAGMTGSGSVVFGRFSSEKHAIAAFQKVNSEAPWVRLTHTKVTKMAKSP